MKRDLWTLKRDVCTYKKRPMNMCKEAYHDYSGNVSMIRMLVDQNNHDVPLCTVFCVFLCIFIIIARTRIMIILINIRVYAIHALSEWMHVYVCILIICVLSCLCIIMRIVVGKRERECKEMYECIRTLYSSYIQPTNIIVCIK